MRNSKKYYVRIQTDKRGKNTRYYVRVQVIASGKSTIEGIFFKKKEAIEFASQLKVDLNRDTITIENKQKYSTKSFIESFQKWKITTDTKNGWHSEKNQRDNISQMKYFIVFCERKQLKYLDDISIHDILDYHNWVATKEYSLSYKRKLFGLVKMLFTYAYKFEFVDKNITEKFDNFCINIEEQNSARALDADEINKFLECCKEWQSKNNNIYDYTFYKDFFLVLLYTGIRAEECALLQKEDFLTEPKHKILYINLPAHKTKMKYKRIIPIHPKIKKIILKLIEKCENGNDYIWKNRNGENLTAQNAMRIFKKIVCKAEILGKVTTNSTRKTFVTVGSKHGELDIKKIAGHRDTSITGNVYHRPNIKQLYDVISKVDFELNTNKILNFPKMATNK